mgnify:CR=1 FL=1|tara:strand:+ start:9754 stop:10299 length:546 start_codon:yes stop_codon:yes gene_type:complete
MVTFADRIITLLAKALLVLAGIGLFLMMIQTAVDVVADNLWRHPIKGNLEIISVYHMVLVVFLPLAFVELENQNIQVDLLWQALPNNLQQLASGLGHLLCVVFFGILARQTFIDALDAMSKNEILMGNAFVTVWPAKFILPIGFFAIFLIALRRFASVVAPKVFPPYSTESSMSSNDTEAE